ncbi:MAG: dihydrolipoamide acetyltransferase component of pyruvate dehydrogenase complex [Betaproteobacteria bacterium]|nr:MAG: dihydrolipoamide acetyltransferase component of pyruvate dehydrogenase complex [Betaproteobacteria bacterium]
MKIFNLPDLGEGLQEAEIVEWHVKPDDDIAADATMVSVETDKAVVDIPAPYAGRVEKLFAAKGEVVRVGAPLIGFEGEAADTGTVVGELEPQHAAAPVAAAAAHRAAVRATPAVRALARDLGVDLAAVKGTGPDGAITSVDVRRAAQAAPVAAEELRGMRREGEELRGMRRAMAQRMAEAHAEVAAVSIFDDADIHAWLPQTPILVRLLRALIAACRAEPALNAWFDGKAGSRRVLDEVHVGIAVDSADGLIVPVLRDAHALELAALEREAQALIDAARARTLPPERLRGATIALSNYGPVGGRYATPIVVPPTVAILGAGRIALRPVALSDGAIVAHRLLPVSLTFDHRAVTGGEAARFLNAVIAALQRAE